MTTVRYMASFHGISKRFRLNNEQSEIIIQEINEFLLPVVRKGLQDIESSNEYLYRNDILSRSDKLKDLHNEVIDSCIDISAKPSAKKCSLVMVYKETEVKVKNSKETDKLVIKHTSNLENDFKKPNSICFNSDGHQTKRESLTTSSQSHQHTSLKKDKTEFSVDSVNSDMSNVFSETCNNLKESTTRKDIAVENNTELVDYEDKWINELPKIDRLKTIHSEECDKTVIISEDINIETEFHNDGGISLEESNNNNFSLEFIGDSLDSLKTKQLGQVSILQESHYNKVNTVKNSEESKSENVKIFEVSKLEKNKTKSDVYYSNAYKMFSNVIQKARNKVKQRTKNSQPSIGITGQNALLEKEKALLETQNALSKNPYTVAEFSRSRIGNDYTDKLRSLLYDMDELDEFFDYCREELFHMMTHFSVVKQILHFLAVEAEHIKLVLQNMQIKYLAKQDGKLNKNDLETAAGTYHIIQNCGHSLLENIIKSGRIWGPAIDKYRSNLSIVLDSFFNFCTTSIESILVDDPDLVFAVFKEVETQVDQAKAIQSQVMTLFHTESAQIQNIRECVNKFKNLSNNTSF